MADILAANQAGAERPVYFAVTVPLEGLPVPIALLDEGYHVIDINPADLYQCEGVYAIRPELPATLGAEGVGVIEAVGDGVTALAVGDRVLLQCRGPNPTRCDGRVLHERNLLCFRQAQEYAAAGKAVV